MYLAALYYNYVLKSITPSQERTGVTGMELIIAIALLGLIYNKKRSSKRTTPSRRTGASCPVR
ncbi:MAG: hypothetical protein ACFFB3_04345 [Candidatus Hodarchaeota archaeon]